MTNPPGKDKKLYHLTSSSFSLVRHVAPDGTPSPLAADSIPCLFWPSGQWCYPANVYMAQLARKSLSRRGRGGTLLTYATQLSHLLRFCALNATDFIDLTDNQFSLFVRGLSAEQEGRPRRSPNSVRAISFTALNFLSFVGGLYGNFEFVSAAGTICAEQVTRVRRKGGAGQYSVSTWRHHAIPLPAIFTPRFPVTNATISSLRRIAAQEPTSSFVRKRRLILLTLLEVTGGRRGEIADLTIQSVRAAETMAKPMLELHTLKTRSTRPRTRLVPIAHHDLGLLRNYIDFYRNPLVKAKIGNAIGDGRLLVSETTGDGLQPDTISHEIWLLHRSAGIPAAACAHMFRHRFCTKILAALIEQHSIANKDEFRRMLVSQKDLKQRVSEWVGHSDPASLDRYLHFAFNEITGLSQSVDVCVIRQKLDSFRTALAERQLEAADPLLAEMLIMFRRELDAHITDNQSKS